MTVGTASQSVLLEQKNKKPDVLRERVSLRFTRNTQPPPERMLKIKQKSEPKNNYSVQEWDIICSKEHPTSSLTQGGCVLLVKPA
jgi:hypothetical protein